MMITATAIHNIRVILVNQWLSPPHGAMLGGKKSSTLGGKLRGEDARLTDHRCLPCLVRRRGGAR